MMSLPESFPSVGLGILIIWCLMLSVLCIWNFHATDLTLISVWYVERGKQKLLTMGERNKSIIN